MIYTFNNKIMTRNGRWMGQQSAPPPVPVLPPFTIRVKFASGYTPDMGHSQTLVDAEQNIWDITKNSAIWKALFYGNMSLLEILGANTTGITDMEEMFEFCANLTVVPLFDTSSVTDMNYMFRGCSGLTTIPLFDTSLVKNMSYMFYDCSSLTTIPLFDTSSSRNLSYTFYNCTNVESGALALYQQASTQTTTTPKHSRTFRNCGSNTTSGAAELAQIPSGWK